MRDLPDFLLPSEDESESHKLPELPKGDNSSIWEGIFLILGLHCVVLLFVVLISPKLLWSMVFFGIPFVQLIYAIPCLLIFKAQQKKRLVRGILFIMLLTLLPLATVMLIAFLGFSLCAVLYVVGTTSHH